ncbi:MAG: glycosyltransferase [Ktedonobacteraceae bacterium]|nr:glycosyltransferase [Ktedonobacteraceae bacterium]
MTFRQATAGQAYVRTHVRPFHSVHVVQEAQRRRQGSMHITSPLQSPRFSIIICTYNRRTMILTALASLRKQTFPYKYFEILIIDNGSTDGTFDAVQTYIDMPHKKQGEEVWRVQCLHEACNGLSHARKRGMEAATGEIVVFLDDDIVVDSRFLEQLHLAYTETGADAVGGCVKMYWEDPRPYWLTDDFLGMLGYYMPFRTRSKLTTAIHFSSSCFSVKREVLAKVGGFSHLLSKRLNMPISADVADLCQRLHQAGCALWYEPSAYIGHRVSQARLKRAFFVGRAYWQGRAEILASYTDLAYRHSLASYTLAAALPSILPELATMLWIAFVHRPLLVLARKSSSERLYAMMAQARIWGRIQQKFILSNHAPIMMDLPAVLLVQGSKDDASLLEQGLTAQSVLCTTSIADIPLAWLWRHRAYQERAVGIIHLYHPGALGLNSRQRQRLLFRLQLARCLGVRIVSTDTGGWWQSVCNLRFSARRHFEHTFFTCSDVVYTFTPHIEQLYPEQRLRSRAYYIPHPGMRGTLLKRPGSSQARVQLGFPLSTEFIYLCFADMHTEREVLSLIDAFSEMRTILFQKEETADLEPRLALIGTPRDKVNTQKILKRAATNSAIHLFLQRRDEDMLAYVEAANAVVLPYFATRMAGVPELAMLFYSYERLVIAADLPRFQDLLPPHACLLYDPNSRSALVRALLTALRHKEYRHSSKEAAALDSGYGWQLYAQRLLESYKTLLPTKTG